MAQDIVSVCDVGDETGILFNQQRGDAFSLDLPENFLDGLHEQGGETLRGLIHKDELTFHPQDPRNGEHLLFPSAQLESPVAAPFLELWKKLVDLFEAPAMFQPPSHGQVQV